MRRAPALADATDADLAGIRVAADPTGRAVGRIPGNAVAATTEFAGGASHADAEVGVANLALPPIAERVWRAAGAAMLLEVTDARGAVRILTALGVRDAGAIAADKPSAAISSAGALAVAVDACGGARTGSTACAAVVFVDRDALLVAADAAIAFRQRAAECAIALVGALAAGLWIADARIGVAVGDDG
jgi:hypothetical protein